MDLNNNSKNNNLKQDLLEIYNSLPKVIQDAITKSGWENKIRDLVNKYNLRIDQGTQLENMTFSLMMGQFSSEDYYNSIISDFGLEDDVARSLFLDIDSEVFGQIEDIIIKLENEFSEKAKEEQKKEEPDNEAEETYKKLTQESERGNYVRSDIDNVAKNDEILTLTRSEILEGIERPEGLNQFNDKYPDLNKSNVMPRNQQSVINNKETDAEKVSTPNANASGADSDSLMKEVPKTESVESADLPKNNLQTAEKTEPVVSSEVSKTEKEVSDDPVTAGLSNSVSTSNRNYNEKDPYREPIE